MMKQEEKSVQFIQRSRSSTLSSLSSICDPGTGVSLSSTGTIVKSTSTVDKLSKIRKKLSTSFLRPRYSINSLSGPRSLEQACQQVASPSLIIPSNEPREAIVERKKSIKIPLQQLFHKSSLNIQVEAPSPSPVSPALSSSSGQSLKPINLIHHRLSSSTSSSQGSSSLSCQPMVFPPKSRSFSQQAATCNGYLRGSRTQKPKHRHYPTHLFQRHGHRDEAEDDNEGDDDEWDFRCQGVRPKIPQRPIHSPLQFFFEQQVSMPSEDRRSSTSMSSVSSSEVKFNQHHPVPSPNQDQFHGTATYDQFHLVEEAKDILGGSKSVKSHSFDRHRHRPRSNSSCSGSSLVQTNFSDSIPMITTSSEPSPQDQQKQQPKSSVRHQKKNPNQRRKICVENISDPIFIG